MITTTYKFRLYPKKDQQEQLWRWSRALNDLYNHFLSLQKQQVAKKLPVLRRFDTHNLIPKLKHEIEHLNDVYSDARQACSDRIATCMILWQRGRIKFPRFRSGYQFFLKNLWRYLVIVPAFLGYCAIEIQSPFRCFGLISPIPKFFHVFPPFSLISYMQHLHL